MLLERIRIFAFEVWMLVYMIFRAIVGFRLKRYRREGRDAEADALVAALVTKWAHSVLRNVRCTLEVEGQEHIPRDRAFVVYANHQSKYDIPVYIAALGVPMGFVTKRELFLIPGLRFWMEQIHCLKLDRSDVHGGAEALARLGAELKATRKGFIIFPEGTRTRDPAREVQPFRRGAVRLASEHGLPVLPVVVDGTGLLDRHEALAAARHGGRHARVRVLPLRDPPDRSAPARRQFMDELYELIRSQRRAIAVEWPRT